MAARRPDGFLVHLLATRAAHQGTQDGHEEDTRGRRRRRRGFVTGAVRTASPPAAKTSTSVRSASTRSPKDAAPAGSSKLIEELIEERPLLEAGAVGPCGAAPADSAEMLTGRWCGAAAAGAPTETETTTAAPAAPPPFGPKPASTESVKPAGAAGGRLTAACRSKLVVPFGRGAISASPAAGTKASLCVPCQQQRPLNESRWSVKTETRTETRKRLPVGILRAGGAWCGVVVYERGRAEGCELRDG